MSVDDPPFDMDHTDCSVCDAARDDSGPGTPIARLTYLLEELEKRFPGVVTQTSSESPEPKLLAAIDAALDPDDRAEGEALLEEARTRIYEAFENRAKLAEVDAARWKKIAFTDYDRMRLASREVLLLWKARNRSPDSEELKAQHEAAITRLEQALAGVPTIGVPVRVLLAESLAKMTAERDALLKRVAELEAR